MQAAQTAGQRVDQFSGPGVQAAALNRLLRVQIFHGEAAKVMR